MPVAENCPVAPGAIDGLVGLTVMDTSATVTVRTVELEKIPDLAAIVVVPVATAVASPFDPVRLLIAATDFIEELQVADCVRSFVLLSE